jgi:hypothetical protein
MEKDAAELASLEEKFKKLATAVAPVASPLKSRSPALCCHGISVDSCQLDQLGRLTAVNRSRDSLGDTYRLQRFIYPYDGERQVVRI